MQITQVLLGEHGVLYALFEHIEAGIPKMEALADVQRAGATLAATLGSHARIENEILFPALEPQLGPNGPLRVMRDEHDEIEAALEDVVNAASLDAALGQLRHAVRIARDHFAKEEQVLFGMAQQMLAADELDRLGAMWAETRCGLGQRNLTRPA
jgi:iron-sulfur cluster repair protein YtfE (RIC family)